MVVAGGGGDDRRRQQQQQRRWQHHHHHRQRWNSCRILSQSRLLLYSATLVFVVVLACLLHHATNFLSSAKLDVLHPLSSSFTVDKKAQTVSLTKEDTSPRPSSSLSASRRDMSNVNDNPTTVKDMEVKQQQQQGDDKDETDDPCSGYDGVLWIRQGDQAGAAGTIFFLFVVNQLMFAERSILLPWIHFNNVSHNIYDPRVHGGDNKTRNTVLRMRTILAPNEGDNEGGGVTNNNNFCPAKPFTNRNQKQSSIFMADFDIFGTGVWTSYFEPVSSFDPNRYMLRQQQLQNNKEKNHTSFSSSSFCDDVPLLTLTPLQILPGLHLHCPWAAHAWRYGGLSDKVYQPHLSLQDWLGDNRRRGSRIVQTYIRPIEELWKASERANPHGSSSSSLFSRSSSSSIHEHGSSNGGNGGGCLAMHVRHSDKANRRRRIKLQAFLPYAESYLQHHPNGWIYMATDSSAVLERLRETWSSVTVSSSSSSLNASSPSTNSLSSFSLLDRIVTQGDHVLRSYNRSAVFDLGKDQHHRTNWEVLVDILAMARCDYFLHGLSAVSEATHYFAYPRLHNRSVNLEDTPMSAPMSVQDFKLLLQSEG